jgi:hypothetical protein
LSSIDHPDGTFGRYHSIPASYLVAVLKKMTRIKPEIS